jgi:nicotinamide phosphoribosyltransferase
MSNLLTLTDGYKLDHRRQYAPGTEYVYSNFTARSVRDSTFNKVIFFGLQGFLQEFLMEKAEKTFFSRNKDDVLDEYQKLLEGYLGFDAAKAIGVEHISDLHDLGYIPLEFRALLEGTHVPIKVPMFTIENTLPEFFWLTNYFETLLSSTVWKMCRNATIALRYRKVFEKYAKETGADPSFIQWQGHDFSFRGMSGPEDAARAGSGHLLSFTGSDTIPCIPYLQRYYDATGLIAGTVPATEHSVMCSGGKEGELATFSRLLDLYPSGIVSVVSDTWDLWEVLGQYLPKLKDKIMSRSGKLVIRPDSGDPVKILCGDPNHPSQLGRWGVVETLWKTFGGTTTNGGRVLDPHIGVIYGDSITLERQEQILSILKNKGFASSNVVLGIGSYTYQYSTRDEFGMAMKATWTLNNGKDTMLHKDPVTDNGTKKSAKGRIAVIRSSTKDLLMFDGLTKTRWEEFNKVNELQPVWRNGQFVRRQTLGDIRDRVQE